MFTYIEYTVISFYVYENQPKVHHTFFISSDLHDEILTMTSICPKLTVILFLRLLAITLTWTK